MKLLHTPSNSKSGPLKKKKNKKQIDKRNTAQQKTNELPWTWKYTQKDLKKNEKERNFNIQEVYKTKIITSMTVNHINQIRQAQRNFTNRKLTRKQWGTNYN